MQVKKQKAFGLFLHERGVRKSLLVFLFLYFMLTFVYSVQTLPFLYLVTNVRQAGFPEHRTTGLNCMDFGTLLYL